MRTLLADWTYSARRQIIAFGSGNRGEVLEQQIVVWLAIAPYGTKVLLEDDHPTFPAVIDTGYGGRLLLNHRHLSDWTGISPPHLVPHGQPETLWGNVVCPRFQFSAWLRCADPVTDRAEAYRAAFRIKLTKGATLILPSAPGEYTKQPRLPLIGMKMLEENRLRLTIDAASHRVQVDTTRNW